MGYKVIVVWFGAGLGNQMFEYAFYQAAIQKGFKVKADLSYFDRHSAHNGYELNRIFKIQLDTIGYPCQLLFRFIFNRRIVKSFTKINSIDWLPWFKFREESKFGTLSGKVSGIAYYKGFWQKAIFSESVKSILRQDFQFPPLVNVNYKVQAEMLEKTSVSIHVRRGDYKNQANSSTFVDLSETDYYKKAFQYIEKKYENPHYFIFSDDMNWCRENLDISHPVNYIDWNTGEMSYVDMQLMSSCKANIIANSTFSWWAAWLNSNEEKIVIAPGKWFVSQKLEQVTFPDSWIVIE